VPRRFAGLSPQCAETAGKKATGKTQKGKRIRTDVVIVGAGAAGLATAIFTRRLNPSRTVLIVDGAAKPGAKILVSGGSRCNVTNAVVTERDFSGGRPSIIRRVLRAFPVAETVEWFTSIGVPLHEEPHGKLFPDSNRSRDVLDALLRELQASGAVLQPSTRARAVGRDRDGFTLETNQGSIVAQRVVLATGGQSLPKTGSDGAGLAMARVLGHTVVATTPALVPLVVNGGFHAQVAGVAHDVELVLWIDNRVARRITGALLWTHFGVSGPAALDISRHWLRAELDGHPSRMTVNFFPGSAFEHIDTRLTDSGTAHPRTSLQNALAQWLPASVAQVLLEHLGIAGSTVLAHLSRDDRRRVTRALVEWPLEITGSRGYNYAEATAGGVVLDEVEPSTMASRRCAGLHLVGEMLDVDGRIGGFNFQWAWASARVASRALKR
jgi:predicted Rossmann fold flavoprotein